jgi:hypothetical protein
MYSLRRPEEFFKHGIFNLGSNFRNFKYHRCDFLTSNLEVCFVQLPVKPVPGLLENMQLGITDLVSQEKALLYKLKITNSLIKFNCK